MLLCRSCAISQLEQKGGGSKLTDSQGEANYLHTLWTKQSSRNTGASFRPKRWGTRHGSSGALCGSNGPRLTSIPSDRAFIWNVNDPHGPVYEMCHMQLEETLYP